MQRQVPYSTKKVRPHGSPKHESKRQLLGQRIRAEFFKTLKVELDVLEGKHSVKEVRTAVFEYIETYYNRKRRHSALGYAIPMALAPNKAA